MQRTRDSWTWPRSDQLVSTGVVLMSQFSQENFEKISRIIKKEFETFDVKKCKDFKDTITQYLENMLK